MTPADPLPALRHRVLEGALARLARRPDARDFVLRGGLLMRHWFAPVPRTADDIDLIASFPFDVDETARRVRAILAEPLDDGVVFDATRTRVTGIRLDSGAPGVRAFVAGVSAGEEIDFNIDVTFGPAPRPAAVRTNFPTARGPISVLACRPESVVCQKVQALLHRGPLGWRPKDLSDLVLLFARVPLDAGDLRAALPPYLAEIDRTGAHARALFGPDSWWELKLCAARWLDFVRAHPELGAPDELETAAAEVARHLLPVLEGAA
jgi:Nucleotidyl transferase AbiEii toxin, Type IV TA system